MPNRTILTTDEVAQAIRVDPDYPEAELVQLAQAATSFINRKTGFDWTTGSGPIDPQAKQCAILYVRQLHYGAEGYNREHDYALGINSLLEDLKDIARSR